MRAARDDVHDEPRHERVVRETKRPMLRRLPVAWSKMGSRETSHSAEGSDVRRSRKRSASMSASIAGLRRRGSDERTGISDAKSAGKRELRRTRENNAGCERRRARTPAETGSLRPSTNPPAWEPLPLLRSSRSRPSSTLPSSQTASDSCTFQPSSLLGPS